MSTASLRLSFPAFVSYDGRIWSAVPLLYPYGFVGIGHNPAVAVDDLERVLQQRYERIEHDEQDQTALSWLSFRPPDLASQKMLLIAGYGKRTLEVVLLVASFVQGDSRYVYLPRLGHWFLIDASIREWQPALQEQLDSYLRARRNDDDEWVPPAEALLRKDRVLPTRVSLRGDLKQFRIGGGHAAFIWRAIFGDDTEQRSPGAEIRKLAEDLTERRSLLRAYVPHPAVEAVYETMLGEGPPLALIGARGSGRTTLVHEAIARMRVESEQAERKEMYEAIRQGRAPRDPRPMPRVYHFDPQRIVTGMSIVGQWQRRLELVLAWVRDRRQKTEHQPGSDIVFVDDPVGLARVGRSRGSDMVASRVFHAWLKDGIFPMVLEATPEQWHRLIELDRPFAELFRVIRVDAPDMNTVITMATHHRARLESAHRTKLTPGAIERALELHSRYGGSRGLPGGLVDRLEAVAAAAAGEVATAETVDRVFRAGTGLREIIADPKAPLEDSKLKGNLSGRLVGQPAAIDALATAVHALKSGLRPPGRPVCCWLFVGPTGVGKTEAAKLLTETLFVGSEHLVRFDMNAFADGLAVSRLIGSLGAGDSEAGLLTTAVRRKPFCVLLLDEIEKAHPSVHDLLLQLLDEGRLTDAIGRTTSFTSCAVVMTSNVGASEITKSVGFSRGGEALEQSYRAAVGRSFRPEFVNRIDRIVAFSGLGPSELRVVASLQLQRLLARDGLRNRTVIFDVTDETLDRLAAEGYDPRFGARGLKRLLERRLAATAAAELAVTSPEQPVRITVSAGEGGALQPKVEPLRWASPVEVPERRAEGDPLEQIARIEQSLEPYRPQGIIATDGERGARLAEILSLVETLRQMRDDLDAEEDPVPDGASAAVRRIANFALTSASDKTRRPHWRSHDRPVIASGRLRAGLRSLLLDLAAPAKPADALAAYALPLIELRAAAVLAGSSARALLRVRPAARATPEHDAAKAVLLEQWSAAASALHARLSRIEARAGIESWLIQGAGAAELFASESGLHWWLPPSGAPCVLEVQVDTIPEDADPLASAPPLAQSAEILRTICPAATQHSHGAVHDLRSGEVVRTLFNKSAADAASYVGWLLTAAGRPH